MTVVCRNEGLFYRLGSAQNQHFNIGFVLNLCYLGIGGQTQKDSKMLHIKRMFLILFVLVISSPAYSDTEHVEFEVLPGQTVQGVYTSESGFVTSHMYDIRCKFDLNITNNTSTDIILYQAMIQTSKDYGEVFISKDITKNYDLHLYETELDAIYYDSDFGGSNGSSGIMIKSGKTRNLTWGWGPSFYIKTKKIIPNSVLEKLQNDFGCGALNEVSIGIDVNKKNYIKFRDGREIMNPTSFFRVKSDLSIVNKMIQKKYSFGSNSHWFEDLGLKM